MRSLSSNLLKMGNYPSAGEKRIIDTNALIAARIGTLREEMKSPENEGFTQGLRVEEIDVQALVDDQNGQNSGHGILGNGMSEEEAREEADKILQEARDQASRILQDAMEQGEKDAKAKAKEAWDAGYSDAKKTCEKEYQDKKKELAAKEREFTNKAKQMEAQYDALVAELEPKFIDTLTGIYEHLFHVELGNYREILLHLASDCMKANEGSKNYQVLVSSEDFPFVNSKKSRLLEAAGDGEVSVEVVEDSSLEKNGCIIKTETGIMDCGLDTQLEELSRKLRLLAYEKHS